MPDVFGNPTPQEVQAQIVQRQQEQLNEMFKGQRGANRGGTAIGAALGRAFRKTRDTSKARKSEEARLAETTGLSAKERKALAKVNEPRQFKEVREAQQMQKVTAGAKETIDFLTPILGRTLAEAAGWNNAGRALQDAGFDAQATDAFRNSVAIKDAEEKRLIALEQSKATLAGTKKTNSRIDTPLLVDLQDERARLEDEQARLEIAKEDETNPIALDRVEERLVEVKREIRNHQLVKGTSETDADYNGLTSQVDSVQLRALQTSFLSSTDSLNRMKTSADSFQPDFLRLEGIAKSKFVALRDFLSLPVSADDKKFLTDQATFMQAAFNNLNLYIKEITGAQMSFQEAERLGRGIPDPSKDTPIEYRAKLIATTKSLLAIQARTDLVLKTGDISLLPKDFSKDAVGTKAFGADIRQFEDNISNQDVIGFLGLAPDIVDELGTVPESSFDPATATDDEAIAAAKKLLGLDD